MIILNDKFRWSQHLGIISTGLILSENGFNVSVKFSQYEEDKLLTGAQELIDF